MKKVFDNFALPYVFFNRHRRSGVPLRFKWLMFSVSIEITLQYFAARWTRIVIFIPKSTFLRSLPNYYDNKIIAGNQRFNRSLLGVLVREKWVYQIRMKQNVIIPLGWVSVLSRPMGQPIGRNIPHLNASRGQWDNIRFERFIKKLCLIFSRYSGGIVKNLWRWVTNSGIFY